MQRLLRHNDFLSNLILEQIESGELPFRLSNRLIKLLSKINHTITDKLLYDNGLTSSKFTLVDYDDNDADKFIFANSPKVIEYITQKTLTDEQQPNLDFFNRNTDIGTTNSIWHQNRTPIRIGRFINKLYPNTFVNAGKPGEDIESFTEAVRTERTKEMGIFKIVEGEDIVKYYRQDSYEKGGNGSSLYSSCMSHDYCSPYISFYSKNTEQVKLVILMGDDDKIIGRALLWNVNEINEEEVDRKFLDRIYTIKAQDIGKFKELARKNNWLYKSTQDMWAETTITDPKTDKTDKIRIKVYNIKEHNAYPYMDTLKYFNTDYDFLTNNHNDEHNYMLESTDGGYTDYDGEEWVYSTYHKSVINTDDMVWSDTESRWLSNNETVYSKNLSEYVSNKYATENWTYCKKEDDWFDNGDVIYIESEDCYVSQEYADDNYFQSSYDYNYYSHSDGVPSEKWDMIPIDKNVRVILDDTINLDEFIDEDNDFDTDSYVDNRWVKDGTYFTIYDPIRKREWNFDISLKDSPIIEKIKKGVI
jgi:hypothetical protein